MVTCPIRCSVSAWIPNSASAAAANAPVRRWRATADSEIVSACMRRSAFCLLPSAFDRAGRRSRGGLAPHIVPIEERVEHHVELAVVLPAIDRVVREQDDASLAAVAAGAV